MLIGRRKKAANLPLRAEATVAANSTGKDHRGDRAALREEPAKELRGIKA